MDRDQVIRMRELLEKIAPAPWEQNPEMPDFYRAVGAKDWTMAFGPTIEDCELNAEFIVLARNLLPNLFQELDRLGRLYCEHDDF